MLSVLHIRNAEAVVGVWLAIIWTLFSGGIVHTCIIFSLLVLLSRQAPMFKLTT